ncbi:hypothetical protein BBF96_04825 [Anoxybacter fermentans]|uniref:Uncharacterized protein n=1 Tax=Anoxybacter fermentans TaxID=1323375 RepID=A0A3Q9HPR4_9FIRM|nr:hypothetical protein [Anoxybacter fermentans]AZR72775.1 hypothetical protein BBF96_04825 [Anoxybacter fermentans]
MKLIKFLKRLLTKSNKNRNILYLYYQCHRCKHAFKLLLRKSYDIQTIYDDQLDYAYLYQKELRDPKCFNNIKFRVYFDRNYNIVKEEAKGGKLISEEEYKKLHQKENK